MITCRRATEILRGLETNKLAAEPEEIEDVLKAGLAVEADPEHLRALHKLGALRDDVPELRGDPFDVEKLTAALARVETDLKSEWHRLKSGAAKIREEETVRIALREALALLRDPVAGPGVRKAAENQVAANALYV